MQTVSVERSIGVGVAVVIIGTPLSLSLIYVDHDLLSVSYGLAFRRVNAWPWFKGGAALAAICCLWPFQALWFSRGNKWYYDGGVAGWAVLGSWFGALLMYPGTRRLDV
jgi:hypothetical protein